MINKSVLLCETEAEYGVDPTPLAVNALLVVGDVTIEPIDASEERDVLMPAFGKLKKFKNGDGVKISFTIEARGSGVKTTAPKWTALLDAAGFLGVVGASSVVFAEEVVTSDVKSVTLYFYEDGLLYKAHGCIVNSAKITGKANRITQIAFELTGLWGGQAAFVSDAAFLADAVFGDANPPPVLKDAAFSFDGVETLKIDSFELTITNTIAKRSDITAASGVARYSVTNREISGSIDPEAVLLATYNPFENTEDGVLGAVALTLGDTEGNIIDIELPRVEKDWAKRAEREGIRTFAIAFNAVQDIETGAITYASRLTITTS